MSTSVKFLKAEAGKQAEFGTPVAPTFRLPFEGEYQDAQEDHVAQYDSGVWTPQEIAGKVADHATFTLKGTAFFELLPIFWNAGYNDITPSGTGPYAYDDALDPAAEGAPIPYTFYFGGGEDIGGTGPAIRIADAYCQSFSLAFGIGAKQIALQSTWFGKSVDDNAGAGFDFIGSNLPGSLEMMKGLLGELNVQDAAATGGDFATMTAFECSLLDWTLTVNTGIRPKWAADNNALTYCGYYYEAPAVTLAAAIRTTSANYANVAAKAKARTYQELELILNGSSARQLRAQLTGRWLPNVTAHGRSGNEVVMNAVFQAGTPYTQTTTPHYFGWELDTRLADI